VDLKNFNFTAFHYIAAKFDYGSMKTVVEEHSFTTGVYFGFKAEFLAKRIITSKVGMHGTVL
jgi:hypothetical protein